MAEPITVDIGGPADVNIVNARRGSPWVLPCTLEFDESDGVDANTVTAAALALKSKRGDSEAPAITMIADITHVSELVVVLTFRATKDETLGVSPDLYQWDFELTAEGDDNPLDAWAPAGGTWRVTDRIVERDEVS